MKNIQDIIINKIDNSMQAQTTQSYHFNKADKTLRDIEITKNQVQNYIEKAGHYLKSAEMLSEIQRIEKGLLKIRSGNYQKDSFNTFKERALSEMIAENKKAINNRLIDLKAKIQKKERDYDLKFSANPNKTELELKRLQAQIDLMTPEQADQRLQNIKNNGAAYNSEIEITMLLNALDPENRTTWKKVVQDLDPAWVDTEVKQALNEIDSLTTITADYLPVKVKSEDGKEAITGVPIIEMLDDISQPSLEMV